MIKRIEVPKTTASGITFSENKDPFKLVVIEVGSGIREEGKFRTTLVSIGQTVILP